MTREHRNFECRFLSTIFVLVIGVICFIGCQSQAPVTKPETDPARIATQSEKERKSVPQVSKWGIYVLDLATEKVGLVYSSSSEISFLNLSVSGHKFAFSQKIDGDKDENGEICTLDIDGDNFKRLTSNSVYDLYPVWSPDNDEIAFLSWRDNDLDIYIIDSSGTNERKLYDSGYHDADIDWEGNSIVFTSNSRIWIMRDDGTQAIQVTEPPKAGQWGNANLPFGDYDPRLNRSGDKIVFERLEDDSSTHGNYNIYIINPDGSGQTSLTDTGYSQGLANWSNSGDRIVYLVAAIGNEGKYDIYMMNSDGTHARNITPDYFPAAFLCHDPLFSSDDSTVFFVGQWWD